MAGRTPEAGPTGPLLAAVRSCPGLARHTLCVPARDPAGTVTAQIPGPGPHGPVTSPGYPGVLAQPIGAMSLCPEKYVERHSHPHPRGPLA